MFNIAVCDSSLREMKKIEILLLKYNEKNKDEDLNISCFNSGRRLLEAIEKGRLFNLILLDVVMNGESGIEIAEIIRRRYEEIPIIFITKYPDYALDSFNVYATGYLLKPVNQNNFFSVLDRVKKFTKPDNFLVVLTQDSNISVVFSSIIYIESLHRILKVHLLNGKNLVSKYIRVSFDDVMSPILNDDRFLHPHKSYVINMNHVKEFTGSSFIMKNNDIIPVPRHRNAEVRVKYFNFLSKYGVISLGGGL